MSEPTLRTLLSETEATINDRPLTYTSSDINDPQPLTPSVLLNGRRAFPKYFCGPGKDHEPVDRVLHSKTEFPCQFTPTMETRISYKSTGIPSNCGNNVQTLKVGDVVQIYDTSPRVNWRLILITELAEGRYPLSRSATIRTSNGRVTSIPLSK